MSDIDDSTIDACPASAGVEVATTPGAGLYDLPMDAKAVRTISVRRKQQFRRYYAEYQ